MFSALWRWFWGEETTIKRSIVRLEDIPTWTDLYSENRQEFIETLSGIKDPPKYEEDLEINSKVSIYGANMISLAVDGIVRSTDATLTSNDGISGAIKTAAGPRLDAELKTLNGCRPGEAKTTMGFNLPGKYIVHTVGTEKEEPEILENCYKSCLKQMRLKNMKTMAFCCISTGINGYPFDKAVLVALKTVRIWLEELKAESKLDEIDRIVFCHFSEADALMYTIWMQIFFPTTYEPEPSPPTSFPVQETAVASSSGSNSENFGEERTSVEDSIALEEKEPKKLRPLPGFIELTTEPDMVTLDDDPNTMRAKMQCGHVIGSESMTEYFRSILKDGKFKFVCPSGNCNSEWEYFLVRHVACLTDKEMHEFEKKLEKNFLDKEKGIQMCPGCKNYCAKDKKAGTRVRCPVCTKERGKKFDFCWICHNEWKRYRWSGPCGNEGCDGKDKRIQILAKCPTKKINYCNECPILRGCPKCGLLVEHKDKCGHVSCSCGCGFCFICLKEKIGGNWQCKPYFGTCQLAPRQTQLPGSQ